MYMPVTAKEKKIILIFLWLGCHYRAEVFFGGGGGVFFLLSHLNTPP